jgi:hypothetical protein
MNINALSLIGVARLEPFVRPLPHHNPDYRAVYRGGMASEGRPNVNLDNGRDGRNPRSG